MTFEMREDGQVTFYNNGEHGVVLDADGKLAGGAVGLRAELVIRARNFRIAAKRSLETEARPPHPWKLLIRESKAGRNPPDVFYQCGEFRTYWGDGGQFGLQCIPSPTQKSAYLPPVYLGALIHFLEQERWVKPTVQQAFQAFRCTADVLAGDLVFLADPPYGQRDL